MFKTIEGSTDCEIRSVIRFLNARYVLPSEIHHQICQVYGDNAMSDGMVRKSVRMFNEGRENVHDEARSGCPSLLNDLVRKVNERLRDDRRFTISDLSLHFLQISRTLFCDIVSSNLGYRKVCARWVLCIADIFVIFDNVERFVFCVARTRERRGPYMVFVGKPEGERPL